MIYTSISICHPGDPSVGIPEVVLRMEDIHLDLDDPADEPGAVKEALTAALALGKALMLDEPLVALLGGTGGHWWMDSKASEPSWISEIEEDEDWDPDDYDDSMDGDHESALASCGWGSEEDYAAFDEPADWD